MQPSSSSITQWATPVQEGVVNGVKGAIHVKNSDLPVSDGYGFAAASLKLADLGDGNESGQAETSLSLAAWAATSRARCGLARDGDLAYDHSKFGRCQSVPLVGFVKC